MTIKQRIGEDMKAALKAGDKHRLGTLRMLRSRMLEAEVALRADRGRDYDLEDDEAIRALSSYAKQRRDSIESFESAGRADLAARERAELGIVQEYLPQQLGEDEIRRLAAQAIAEVNAAGPRDMGAVMKALMPRLQGRADGKLVNRMVRELLER